MVDQFDRRMTTLRKRITAWVDVVEMFRSEHRTRLVMVTLTYREVGDYRPSHINDYIKRLKERLGSRLLAWCWVAEVQERGAVHYHLLVLVTPGTNFPTPDRSRMWRHGMSKIETARSPWYLVKYVGKEHQKDFSRFPKSCRSYGSSVRFAGAAGRDAFRLLSGIVGEKNTPPGEWDYIGSSVTEEYARDILVCRASGYTDVASSGP
jgi:hypothetical protein